MPNPGSTTARGYDGHHKAVRREWAVTVNAGEAYCAATTCGDPHGTGRWLPPATPWDLGHTEDRTAFSGPEHRRCNRRDGAVRRTRVIAQPLRWTKSLSDGRCRPARTGGDDGVVAGSVVRALPLWEQRACDHQDDADDLHNGGTEPCVDRRGR